MSDSTVEKLSVGCCIAGGGPAGMTLGYLLARAGVEVAVLEKHADFLRDFRGDTIHPSTLEVLYELGLLEEFLKRPHQVVKEIGGYVGSEKITVADFTHLPTHCPYIALMPQWDFLNFLSDHARQYPTFHLRMECEVVGILEDEGRVVGVRANSGGRSLEVLARVTIGADGRRSTVRALAKLEVDDFGSPIDVLWMRLSRRPDDPEQTLGYFHRGRILIMLNREDYWQCGFVIHKGGSDEIRQRGLESFREAIVEIVPFMRDRVAELHDWDDIKLLTVCIDRLRRWYREGLAVHRRRGPCDVAGRRRGHQSRHPGRRRGRQPAGGSPAKRRCDDGRFSQSPTPPPVPDAHDADGCRSLCKTASSAASWAAWRATEAPFASAPAAPLAVLRRIPARVVGIGIRPEHVQTPAVSKTD